MEKPPKVFADAPSDWEGHQWSHPDYVDWWIQSIEADPVRNRRHVAERTYLTRLISELAPAERQRDGLRMMDLGCGWGGLAAELLAHLPGSTVVAVDGSEAMIERCKERLEPYRDRCEYVVANLERPLAEELATENRAPLERNFDVVVSSRALHHIERRRLGELYVEIAQNLASGGYFLNLDRLLPSRRAALADHAALVPGGRWLIENTFPRWLRWGGYDQQHELLAAAGFEVQIDRYEPEDEDAKRPWIIKAKKPLAVG